MVEIVGVGEANTNIINTTDGRAKQIVREYISIFKYFVPTLLQDFILTVLIQHVTP